MNTAAPPLPEPTPDRVTWQGNGWTIDLTLENGAIATASIRWDNEASDAVFLTTLSHSLKGMSLREARDHGVQYACAALKAAGKGTKVAGIVIPANYSETSREVVKALRTAIDSATPPKPADWNFEDHGLSDAWRRNSTEQRTQQLEALFKEYLQASGLPDGVSVADIDQYDRVFILFDEGFSVAQKSSVLMQLERHVRRATGERIELFVSEMKDNNRIRRL